jgi:ABC-2 type transport system permease protein
VTAALAMVGLLWRRLQRDRLGLALTFALPVAVAIVMVGIYTADYSRLGVLLPEGDPVAEDLVGRLEADGVVDVVRYDGRAGLEDAIRRREVVAGVVVPAGAGTAGGPDEVELLGPPGIEAPSGVRAAVEAAVARTAAVVEVGQAREPGAPAARVVAAGTEALSGASGLAGPERGNSSAELRRLNIAWAMSGTLVLFVFLNTVGGAGALADLRQLGILARARTTPASTGAIAAGYGLAMMSYALVQAGLLLGTGWLLFGLTWADWPAFLLVVALLAAAAAALSVALSTVLPSPEMGATVAGPIAFVLAMLGGCLWPLEIVGPGLARAAHLTPHAWALQALRDVGVDGDGLSHVTTDLAVLVAMTVALVAVGGLRLRRITTAAQG